MLPNIPKSFFKPQRPWILSKYAIYHRTTLSKKKNTDYSVHYLWNYDFCVYVLNIWSWNRNGYEKQNKRNGICTYECKGRAEERGAVVKGRRVESVLSTGYGVDGIQIKSKRVDFRACGVSAGVGVHRRRGRRLTWARAPITSTPNTDQPSALRHANVTIPKEALQKLRPLHCNFTDMCTNINDIG